ncbi:MAG: c-type cytochrome [Gammaproteobacteria bacterium]|nr:c-type cytochrome [Gammaproteobacteria bacterium]
MKSLIIFGSFIFTIATGTVAFAHEDEAEIPADTYFAMAVTENSHNHYGENLLYLDFQEHPDTSKIAPRIVISPRINSGSLTIDGKSGDWNPTYLTKIWGRVMNNYPLSEFYDAVPGEITMGSAWDEDYVYFLVQWEDANHDASIYRNLWIYNGDKWSKKEHVKPNPGTPAANAINTTDEIFGSESEDRVFFMFPVRDMQRNFREGGLGCAAYCHANAELSGTSTEAAVGEDVAAMHTNVPEDKADVWHWTSTRSLPSNTLKDGHLVYGIGDYNGRKGDKGNAPTVNNDSKKLKHSKAGQPAFMSYRDYAAGNYGSDNKDRTKFGQSDAIPMQEVKFVKGDTIPYSISRPSTGSRGDVTALATFDEKSHRWTLEIKRARNTGDGNDYQFMTGTDANAPDNPAAIIGDPKRGEQLYLTHGCSACHQDKGQGLFQGGKWTFPRVQRSSGATILKTVRFNREMRGAVRSFIADEMKKSAQRIMPDIQISEQEAEDIASWLQLQFTTLGN